jgi:hypothetical protein
MPLEVDALDELDALVELALVDPLVVPFGAELHALAARISPSPSRDRYSMVDP